MIFKSIQLANFKCYETANAEFHPSINCIVGNNGAGKTNLIDALYYCCFTKSHFGYGNLFVYRHGSSYFRIDAHLQSEDEGYHLIIKSKYQGKKTIELNGVTMEKVMSYIGKFNAVMIAPDDNYIILGGSELRRKFMDGCIGQYDRDYLRNILLYQKFLKQRNALLKQRLKTGSIDSVLLETIDEQLSQTGDLIYQSRKKFSVEFNPCFAEKYQMIAGSGEPTSIEYTSQLEKASLGQLLESSHEKDMLLGRTTYGPHRDDLRFSIFDKPLKSVGSQGQQKSFLVALKLAQYELITKKKQSKPFLFLDDLFDKFDRLRIEHIMEMVRAGDFGQVFITDTNEDRVVETLKLYNLQYGLIRVENTQIQYG